MCKQGAASTLSAFAHDSAFELFSRSVSLFYRGSGRATDALYRINIDTGAVEQITFSSTGATFWLSPDGTTVYFANTIGPAGNPGIYAVNSDGSNMHLLRQYPSGFLSGMRQITRL